MDNKTPICYEEKQNEIDLVLIPIPEIIAQLGLLTGASMKQPLDSAFDWQKDLIKTNETTKRDELVNNKSSPIFKNPLSFRKTLQQISQQFKSVLNTINTNSEKMFAIMEEARTIWKAAITWFYDTHALNDYLTHSQELNTFIFFFSKQLADLKEKSDKMVLLSDQNSVELQWMTNLTEALTEAVYATHEAKLEYTNGTLRKEIEAKTNRKTKLEKEIRALKEEHQQLNHKVAKSEDKFYQKVERFLHAVQKHQKNSKVRQCLENVAITNWNETGDFYFICRAKSSRLERRNLRAVKIANFIWKTFLQALNDVSNNLGKIEEQHGKLVLVVQLLEQTKNELEHDILFLDSTTELVDKLEKKMEELTFDGWKKLARLCLEIQSAISIIKGRVLSYNELVNLKRIIPSEKSLQEMNQQLIKTKIKMSLVGNAVGAYMITYESELPSLMNQLEEITKADNENLAELEEQLINACKKASNEIEVFLAAMNNGISSISNSAYSL